MRTGRQAEVATAVVVASTGVVKGVAAKAEAAMVAAGKEEGALDACAPVRRRRRSSAQTETEDKTEAGVSASVTHMGRAAACLGAHGRRRWG